MESFLTSPFHCFSENLIIGLHPFESAAITAIHQGAGGLFRKAKHLAWGAIVVASKTKTARATADHVRLAATEIFQLNRGIMNISAQEYEEKMVQR